MWRALCRASHVVCVFLSTFVEFSSSTSSPPLFQSQGIRLYYAFDLGVLIALFLVGWVKHGIIALQKS